MKEETKYTYGMNLYFKNYENQEKDVWIKFKSTEDNMQETMKVINGARPVTGEELAKKSEEAYFIEVLEILSDKVEDLRIFFSEEALRDYDRKEWEKAQNIEE